jgi:hypothetical protein
LCDCEYCSIQGLDACICQLPNNGIDENPETSHLITPDLFSCDNCGFVGCSLCIPNGVFVNNEQDDIISEHNSDESIIVSDICSEITQSSHEPIPSPTQPFEVSRTYLGNESSVEHIDSPERLDSPPEHTHITIHDSFTQGPQVGGSLRIEMPYDQEADVNLFHSVFNGFDEDTSDDSK